MNRIPTAISNRIANVSVVCAILVVLIHVPHPQIKGSASWLFDSLFGLGISKAAVPLFFFISGFLLSYDISYRALIWKKFKSLMVPYFIWSALSLLVKMPEYVLAVIRGIENARWVDSNLVDVLGLNLSEMPAYGLLWYLRCLFMFVLLTPIIILCLRNCGWWLPYFLFLLNLVFSAASSQICSDWCGFLTYGLSLMGLLMYSIGALLRINLKSFEKILEGCPFSFIAFILGVGMILCLRQVDGLVVLKPIALLLASYGIWGMVPTWRFPKNIVSMAMPIYLIHGIVLYFMCLFPRIVPSTESLGGLIFRWVMAVGCSMVIGLWGRVSFNRIFSFVLGGR